ncbi:unnamed protein product, partial [marine sediment metagenome]
LLKLKIEEAVKTENHKMILSLRSFFGYILKRDLNNIFTSEGFLSNIHSSFKDINKARSYVFPLLITLMDFNVRNIQEVVSELIKKICNDKNLKYLALLANFFRKNHFDLIPIKGLHDFFINNDNTVRKDIIEQAKDLAFLYPLLHASAEKGDTQSDTILSALLREILDYDISYMNNNKQYLKYIIPEWEVRAINWLDQKLPGELRLVEPFFYDTKNKSRDSENIIPNWWDDPFQFYIKNDHVEGIALMDINHCDYCVESKDMYIEYGEIEPGN